jgi:gas vesicle protein
MIEFIAGMLTGGVIGAFVVAFCAAAARGDQPRGDHHWHVGDDGAPALHFKNRRSE